MGLFLNVKLAWSYNYTSFIVSDKTCIVALSGYIFRITEIMQILIKKILKRKKMSNYYTISKTLIIQLIQKKCYLDLQLVQYKK